jgi:hypothetical protein
MTNKSGKFTKLAFAFVIVAVVLISFIALTGFSKPSQATDDSVNLLLASYDNDHAVVEYEVNGNFDVPSGYLPIACPVNDVRILNSDGEDITGNIFTSCRREDEGRYIVDQFFYNDFSENLPKQLKIIIGEQVLIPAGNGEISYSPLIGEYKFDDKFQRKNDITVAPTQGTENNNYAVYVQRVDFAPALAKINACLNFPDTRDWGPTAYLVIGGKSYLADEWGLRDYKNPKTFAGTERCYTFLFYTDLPDLIALNSEPISFEVDNIHINFPDCVDSSGLDKIKDELVKFGITPQLDQSGDYCFGKDLNKTSKISSDDQAKLTEYIRNALAESINEPAEVRIR